MSLNSSKNQAPTYTIVLRCAEGVMRIPVGKGIQIGPINTQHGAYQVKFLTRTDELKGIATPLPRELWIEVTGSAPNVDVALNTAASLANYYVRQLAFAANAWHGLLGVHLAYESTPGSKARLFFQNWLRDEVGLPRVARNVNTDLMLRVVIAITRLPQNDQVRVIRAITQYTDALQHWRIGGELYSLAHLYMGVEAITPSVIRRELDSRALKHRRQLEMQIFGVSKDSLVLKVTRSLYRRAGGYIRPPNLDSWARRQLIFDGDDETFRTAKQASDNLEHGLAHHEEIHQLAVKCVEKCASYLRKAILTLLPISDEDRLALMEKPYTKPATTSGFDRRLLATIMSDLDDIAAPDQAYPYVRWEFNLKGFSITDSGDYRMHVTQNITPIIAPKAKMQLNKIRFAGPSETTHSEVEVKVHDTKPDEPIAGVGFLIDDPASSKWVKLVGGFLLNCNALRHLGWYWMQRLCEGAEGRDHDRSMQQYVAQIEHILDRQAVPQHLREQSILGWREALELEKLRLPIAGCVTKPDGLVCIDEQVGNSAPLLEDVAGLRELNDKVVDLAKTLRILLGELLQLPEFPVRKQT
jgi:hypothetical protein